jgi:hypothetical protein
MILFLLLILCNLIVGIFLPWWVLIPVAFALCFGLSKSLKWAFLIPFLSVFVLWFVLSFYYSMDNHHVLARRVAELFGLGNSPISWLWIILLGPLPGGITASFAGASGFLAKKVLLKK